MNFIDQVWNFELLKTFDLCLGYLHLLWMVGPFVELSLKLEEIGKIYIWNYEVDIHTKPKEVDIHPKWKAQREVSPHNSVTIWLSGLQI